MDRIGSYQRNRWRQAGRAFTLIEVRRAHVRAAEGADMHKSRWLAPEKPLA